MLHLIRTWGVEKKWVFGLVMGFVVLAFVGTMGWMGMSGPGGVYAAKVNGKELLITQYERDYKSRYNQLKQIYGEQFDAQLITAMSIDKQVVSSMITQRLWLDLASELGLYASDKELRDVITGIPSFQVNDRFNAAQYKRVLLRNRLNPEVFEASLRADIASDKAKSIIGAAARVTEQELDTLGAVNDELSAAEQAEQDQRRKDAIISRKRNQMVSAYTEHLRSQAKIEVFWDAIKQATPVPR